MGPAFRVGFCAVRKLLASVVVVAMCVAALSGAALAAFTHWANLRLVVVTVQNGSLPPPYGRPHTKRFRTARQLKQVTGALNRNRIAARAKVGPAGCTGGFVITITISPRHGKQVKLTGYRCGGRTSGSIAGNVPGFMRAVGVHAP